MSIRYFYDETAWRLKNSRKIKKLIFKVICEEGKIPGDLNFIFTPDENMLSINREFLKHNYYTDVITFGENYGKSVSGEVYVGFETVKRNSRNYKVSYMEELCRVIIHGTLHLCGYDDKSDEERAVMKSKEDFWIDYLERKEDEL